MAIDKQKRHKSVATDQIPAEMIKAGGKQFALRSINLLILYEKRRNCLRNGWSWSLYLSIRRVIKDCSNYGGISLLSTTYKLLSNILVSLFNSLCREDYWGSSGWISMPQVNYWPYQSFLFTNECTSDCPKNNIKIYIKIVLTWHTSTGTLPINAATSSPI